MHPGKEHDNCSAVVTKTGKQMSKRSSGANRTLEPISTTIRRRVAEPPKASALNATVALAPLPIQLPTVPAVVPLPPVAPPDPVPPPPPVNIQPPTPPLHGPNALPIPAQPPVAPQPPQPHAAQPANLPGGNAGNLVQRFEVPLTTQDRVQIGGQLC